MVENVLTKIKFKIFIIRKKHVYKLNCIWILCLFSLCLVFECVGRATTFCICMHIRLFTLALWMARPLSYIYIYIYIYIYKDGWQNIVVIITLTKLLYIACCNGDVLICFYAVATQSSDHNLFSIQYCWFDSVWQAGLPATLLYPHGTDLSATLFQSSYGSLARSCVCVCMCVHWLTAVFLVLY